MFGEVSKNGRGRSFNGLFFYGNINKISKNCYN